MSELSTIAGFPCRPAVMADAAAVIGLIHEAQMVDVGQALLEQSDVEADWAASAMDLPLDTLLVFDGEQLVGAGEVLDERADIHVLPAYRGRGVGVGLLEWSEARALAQTASGAEPRVGQTVPTGSQAAELLQSRGYEPLWDSWVLRLQAGARLDPRPTPGVTVRPYRPEEERDIHALVDAAFSEWPGRSPRPFDAWREHVIDRSDFDPALLLVAVADEGMVGAIFGINYPDEGWVDQVAVVPSHRNKGIASTLLAALHSEFTSRGQPVFGLNTDSRTGALDLYLRLGMEVEHSFTRYSRALS